MDKYQKSYVNEQKLNKIEEDLDEKDEVLGPSISNTESYVGKYADVDGDGEVDGIIYADLAVGGSGIWNPLGNPMCNSYGEYIIPNVTTGLKEYCVRNKKYTNAINGEQEVIRAKTISGKPRFYVMALTDIDETCYDWYKEAYAYQMKDYESITSVDFGKGASNTTTMVDMWEAKAYGRDYYYDLWGEIQDQVEEGWYVPSRAEWAAFGANLSINKSNYANKGLSNWYWSSSQYDTAEAYVAKFRDGCMHYSYVDSDITGDGAYVRLGTTF
mgnify:FL=1